MSTQEALLRLESSTYQISVSQKESIYSVETIELAQTMEVQWTSLII